MATEKQHKVGSGGAHSKRRSSLTALIALIAAGVVAVTMASALGAFNATVTQNGAFTSGSIVLKETQGATNCFSTGGTNTPFTTNSSSCSTIDVFGAPTGQLPGGSAATQPLTFQNVGTSPASTFTVTPGPCAAAGTGSYYGNATSSAFCGIVDITIGNQAGTVCYYPAQASACPALSNTYNLASLNTFGAVTIGSGLAAAATDSLTISTKLDSTATNADQGLAATQGFTWTLNQ